MPHSLTHAGYLLTDDPSLLDVDAVHAFLRSCYWSEGIPREIVATAMANSLCLGTYTADRQQVGLVRVITDYATFAYLCDVYVHEAHRGRGLSKAAMQLYATHPRLQTLRRQHLVTRDAHGLYAQYGFKAIDGPERHMEKRDPDIYKRMASKTH